jgi:hypothetical protein
MLNTTNKVCPGCNGPCVESAYFIPQQPIILNYRFATAAESKSVFRENITLVQCRQCGLVFNGTFVSHADHYNSNYNNTQFFSGTFEHYVNELARAFVGQFDLHQKRILEVGCGKGHYLKILCRLGNNIGVGYDTTYDGPPELPGGQILFYREYVFSRHINQAFDAIICRHVIEHVPNIGAFLLELRDIAKACGNPVVFLETPSFEWIVKQGCYWDVFYEHCNYFSLPCLEYLCRMAGFEVLRQEAVFGGQYQTLVLTRANSPATGVLFPPGIIEAASLELFTQRVDSAKTWLEKQILSSARGGAWAIWGAGAKGVALVNQIRIPLPRFIIDINPEKQGGWIPGTEVPIVAPEDSRIRELAAVLIANPNYLDEITRLLRQQGYANSILTA